jgi:hypothetical protein
MKEEDGRTMRKVYCYLRFIDVRTDNAHIRVGESRRDFSCQPVTTSLPTGENRRRRFKDRNVLVKILNVDLNLTKPFVVISRIA